MQISIGVETSRHALSTQPAPSSGPGWKCESHQDFWRQGRDDASCRAAKDTESRRCASVDYQFKFFWKWCNSCSGAAAPCLRRCDDNALHTCTQMNTNRIIEITVVPFYTETRHLGSFVKKKKETCTSSEKKRSGRCWKSACVSSQYLHKNSSICSLRSFHNQDPIEDSKWSRLFFLSLWCLKWVIITTL